MRLIRKKSDWWIILAIYGGGAICLWLIIRDPFILGSLIPSIAIPIGIFFVGAILYVPAKVFYDWLVNRKP